MGGKINHNLNRTGGAPYIFSIGGQIFHRLGSLLPPEGRPPKYAQLFVFDTENEIKHRMNSCPSNINGLSEQIIKELKDMFDEQNVLVGVFRYARDRLNADGVENVKIKLTANHSSDRREYDLPTMDELAILIVDETGEDTYHPNIIVQHISNEMERRPEVQFMIDLVRETRVKDPNRADVMARVFKTKLNQLISEIRTKEIFGNTVACK
ncbi:hypothetical protein LINPERHAP1_LOCUS17467 [Linum perenne]